MVLNAWFNDNNLATLVKPICKSNNNVFVDPVRICELIERFPSYSVYTPLYPSYDVDQSYTARAIYSILHYG